MNTQRCVDKLVQSGAIPQDAEVVSTNNKVVTISRKRGLVSRISDLDVVKSRDDPHNLAYSHRVAWLAGVSAAVVRPTQEEPDIHAHYLVSNYPLMEVGSLDSEDAQELQAVIRGFGNALPVVEQGMEVRKVSIPSYVNGRLTDMQDNPMYNQLTVDQIASGLQYLERKYPFEQLVDDDRALIHGDLKADNIVRDRRSGRLRLIDLDAAAVGPRYFDLASWRLRQALGDQAPVEEVAEVWRSKKGWNEEAYRALIGWKAISSMSFTARYETPEVSEDKVTALAAHACQLAGLLGFSRKGVVA